MRRRCCARTGLRRHRGATRVADADDRFIAELPGIGQVVCLSLAEKITSPVALTFSSGVIKIVPALVDAADQSQLIVRLIGGQGTGVGGR